jgi:hypothetical protein
MKLLRSHHELLPIAALFLVTYAFAANKCSFHINTPESIAGRLLPAGDYTARWEDAETGVRLKILQAGKVVASAPAKVIVLNHSAANNSTLTFIGSNGERRLQRIYISGKKFAIEVGGPFDARALKVATCSCP